MISPYAFPGLVATVRNAIAPKPSMDDVTVCFLRHAGKDIAFVLQRTRRREVVKYRQALMYYLRQHTAASLLDIGAFLGGYDHTSIIHSIQTVKNLMKTDVDYRIWLQGLNPKKI